MKISPEKEMQIRIEIAANHARPNPDKIDTLCERLGVSSATLYRVAEDMDVELVKKQKAPLEGELVPRSDKGHEGEYRISNAISRAVGFRGKLKYKIDGKKLTVEPA
jgi:DNA-binding MurR/RpiR family transcriptional regulator